MEDFQPHGLILDFDGVFTDNTVYTDSFGNELIKTSKYDSLSLKLFKSEFSSFPIVVISSESNNCVKKRCEKLGLNLYFSVDDKVKVAKDWANKNKLDLQKCFFLCNDVNDIELCKIVGFPIGVADCNRKIKPYIKTKTLANGGNGAISEILNVIKNNLSITKENQSIAPSNPINEIVGFREWGEEKLLFLSPNYYTVKRLFIKKGFKGGLQKHRLKDESSFLVSGKLLIRYDSGDGNIKEKILLPGSSIRFKPGCVHQEEALADTVIIECSSPHFNDRVRMESYYKIEADESKGLKTTSLFEIEIK